MDMRYAMPTRPENRGMGHRATDHSGVARMFQELEIGREYVRELLRRDARHH